MFRGLQHRTCIGEGGVGFDQLSGGVDRATDFTAIAVLVFGVALGALTLDVAIGQEHAFDWIVKLFDGAGINEACGSQCAVDVLSQLDIIWRIRAVPVVEFNVKAVQVGWALGRNLVHQLGGRNASAFSLEHDGGTVGVIRAHKMYSMSRHSHGPDPDVGLDIFHDVADVKRAVGVRQGGRNKYRS